MNPDFNLTNLWKSSTSSCIQYFNLMISFLLVGSWQLAVGKFVGSWQLAKN
jgi:hypothetical protein